MSKGSIYIPGKGDEDIRIRHLEGRDALMLIKAQAQTISTLTNVNTRFGQLFRANPKLQKATAYIREQATRIKMLQRANKEMTDAFIEERNKRNEFADNLQAYARIIAWLVDRESFSIDREEIAVYVPRSALEETSKYLIFEEENGHIMISVKDKQCESTGLTTEAGRSVDCKDTSETETAQEQPFSNTTDRLTSTSETASP